MTPSNEPDDHCLLLELTPPTFRQTEEEYAGLLISDTIRRRIGVPSDADAPHGYYVVGGAPGTEEDYLFAYFRGTDIHAALREARATITAPPQTGTAPGNSASPQDNAGAAAETPRDVDPTDRASSGKPPSFSPSDRSSSAVYSLSERMEAPRMVDPLRTEHVKYKHTQAVDQLQAGITRRDGNSLIPISGTASESYDRPKLYTVELTLSPKHHPCHDKIKYVAPIDTAGRKTWFLKSDFKKLPDRCRDASTKVELDPPVDWYPAGEIVDDIGVYLKNAIIPTAADGTPIQDRSRDDRIPSPPNEWSVRYEDDGAVYIRNYPDSKITTISPCWSWRNGTESKTSLQLPCVLAYAANTIIVKQPYDGNIGLAVPCLDWSRNKPSSRPPGFFDALDPHDRPRASHVDEPRRFLIKLNHPDEVAACAAANAPCFMYFGNRYPCTLKPRFTQKLYTLGHWGANGEARFRRWALQLHSMRLVVPDSSTPESDSDLTITFDKPVAEGGRARNFADSIAVYLDTGSSHTYLPEHAVETISTVWLRNPPSNPDDGDRATPRTDHIHCGPERNLDECDIVFTFLQFGTKVPFQCPAKPFLKSPIRYSRRAGAFHTNVACGTPEADAMYALGINFYWATFVWHGGPVYSDQEGRITDHPYVQLAPQRAVHPDGGVCHADGFKPFPHLPPRFFEEPLET